MESYKMHKQEINVLNKENPTPEEVQQDLIKMQREVKKHLKRESKNQLIAMIQQLILEKYKSVKLVFVLQ